MLAPKDLVGIDGVGVRRMVRAGSVIPPGLTIDDPSVVRGPAEPPEAQRLRAEKARRAAVAAADTDPAA